MIFCFSLNVIQTEAKVTDFRKCTYHIKKYFCTPGV